MNTDFETIKELREQTGAGILACKQALEKTGGDLDKAIDRLRVEGQVRAAKRVGRQAKEGLIRMRVASEDGRAALVELNCETDFVARTEDFRELADWLLEEVWNSGEEVAAAPPTEERVKEVSGRTGEKIVLGRVLHWRREGFVEGYLHHNGRAAALVELNRADPEAAREVAMQVVVSRPEYLDEGSVPEEVVRREMEIFRQQAADKPEQVRDKVAAGKWRKRLSEVCLLDMPYIRDPKLSVRDYLKQRSSGEPLEIKDFAGWRLGEK